MRVHPVARVVGPAPPVEALGAGYAVGAHVFHNPEAEPEPDAAFGAEHGAGVVQVPDQQPTEVIHRHEFHALRREDAGAAQPAAVQQHLEEPPVVRGRRKESGAPGEARPRPVHVRPLSHHAAGVGSAGETALAGRIHDGQAVALFGREVEVGVRHPQRFEDAGPEELVERQPRGDFDDRAQDVGRVAVDPRLRRGGFRRAGKPCGARFPGSAPPGGRSTSR